MNGVDETPGNEARVSMIEAMAAVQAGRGR